MTGTLQELKDKGINTDFVSLWRIGTNTWSTDRPDNYCPPKDAPIKRTSRAKTNTVGQIFREIVGNYTLNISRNGDRLVLNKLASR